jgi:hypothetical protein
MKQIHFRSQEVAPNLLFAVGLEKGGLMNFCAADLHSFVYCDKNCWKRGLNIILLGGLLAHSFGLFYRAVMTCDGTHLEAAPFS